MIAGLEVWFQCLEGEREEWPTALPREEMGVRGK